MTTLLRKAAPLAVVAAAASLVALHHARPLDTGAFGRSAIGSGVSAPPNVGAASGILPVANGGTGASTLTGVLHGAGTSTLTASSVVAADTDSSVCTTSTCSMGSTTITTTGTINGGTFSNSAAAVVIKAGNNTINVLDSGGGTDATFTTSSGNVSFALANGSALFQTLVNLWDVAVTNNAGATTNIFLVSDSAVANSSAGTALFGVYGEGLKGESTAANTACSAGTATVTVVSPTMTVNPSGAACVLTMATTNVTTIARDIDVEVVINGSAGAGVVTFASTNFTHLLASCTTTGVVNGDAVHFRWSATLSKWVYVGGCA